MAARRPGGLDARPPVGWPALTQLFWLHVRPYGEVRLDLNARLSIGALGALDAG